MGGKFIDYSGERNGMITIDTFSHKSGKSIIWNYTCDCGKTGKIASGDFKRNRTSMLKSCGCIKPHVDLSGKKFGHLKALNIIDKKGWAYYWLCRCDCGKEVSVRQESLTRSQKLHCGCKSYRYTEKYFEYYRKVIKKRTSIDSNGCWIWTGPVCSKDGYGCFPSGKISQRTHRASYKLFVGEIPKGKWVLHKCDVKPCCNPDHLYLGDAKQNVKDAIERGQFPRGPNLKKGLKGEKNGRSILTEKKVKTIRKLNKHGCKPSVISNFYDVGIWVVRQILRGQTWKHI